MAQRTRALSPRTEEEYKKALMHCFGRVTPPFKLKADLSKVGSSRMVVLKSATKWACLRHKADVAQALEQFPLVPWAPYREVDIPAPEEALAFEEAAKDLPLGRRAAALLPLAMGLRANEVITLPRAAVIRAYEFGELLVLRKGGKEWKLPVPKHAKWIFKELLESPRAASKYGITKQLADFRLAIKSPKATFGDFRKAIHMPVEWDMVGDILSKGTRILQYHALYADIRHIGNGVSIKNLRPHKLRHIFATRMARKGAPIPVIQYMLGHKSMITTLLYVHPAAEDALQYL